MNIQSNITIFTGDTQSRSQAERAGADRNTQDSKGKSATFYAGNLLAEFPLQDRLQQRRAQAQERAMKIVSDTWDGDRMIDEQIQESRGRLRELRSTYKDAQDSLRALEGGTGWRDCFNLCVEAFASRRSFFANMLVEDLIVSIEFHINQEFGYYLWIIFYQKKSTEIVHQ